MRAFAKNWAARTASPPARGTRRRFIDKHDVRAARRERGRFRSFLLASLKHFILNDIQSRRAVKRGGGRTPLSLEFETAEGTYVREPSDTRTPETIFDRRWALTVLDRVLQRLRCEARRLRLAKLPSSIG